MHVFLSACFFCEIILSYEELSKQVRGAVMYEGAGVVTEMSFMCFVMSSVCSP